MYIILRKKCVKLQLLANTIEERSLMGKREKIVKKVSCMLFQCKATISCPMYNPIAEAWLKTTLKTVNINQLKQSSDNKPLSL